MDVQFGDRFLTLWAKYSNGAALPMGFYYTDDEAAAKHLRPTRSHACLTVTT